MPGARSSSGQIIAAGVRRPSIVGGRQSRTHETAQAVARTRDAIGALATAFNGQCALVVAAEEHGERAVGVRARRRHVCVASGLDVPKLLMFEIADLRLLESLGIGRAPVHDRSRPSCVRSGPFSHRALAVYTRALRAVVRSRLWSERRAGGARGEGCAWAQVMCVDGDLIGRPFVGMRTAMSPDATPDARLSLLLSLTLPLLLSLGPRLPTYSPE